MRELATSATLEGKIALVTGGSRGIGRAIGVALGQLGAKVVLNYTRNEAAAGEAAAAVVASPAPTRRRSTRRSRRWWRPRAACTSW
jgi:NAD(P)-dependent dehydrogenase (short-subunit alcohol dehydrogenase family)